MFSCLRRPAPMLLLIVPVLAACGGGGGGGGPAPTAFVSNSDFPDNGQIQIDGETRGAGFVFDTDTGEVVLGPVSQDASGRLLATTQDGQAVLLQIIGQDAGVAFDLLNGATVSFDGDFLVFESPDGDDIAFLFDGLSAEGFEYQILGAWLTGFNGLAGTVSAGAFGAQTPGTSMPAPLPAGQTATYDGAAVGFARLADGGNYRTDAFAEVSTDFATATVTTVGTLVLNLDTGAQDFAPDLDFTGSGPVTGSGFAAAVSGTGSSGVATGVFHGPGAEEVGGTYDLSGPGGVRHIGAFGGQ